jgi:hypothetical protein
VLSYGKGKVSLDVTFWFALIKMEGHVCSLSFHIRGYIPCLMAEDQVAHFADVETTYLFDG